MASETDLINAALVKIGEKRITSQGFATPTNERERIANEHYERLRDAELRKNRWNFAMKRAVLAPEALGDRGQVFETGRSYRRAVDERLFRLGAQRYDALMDTLIQLTLLSPLLEPV